MFKMKFKVVEIRENGVVITRYWEGCSRKVKKDVENIKKISKKYEMFGKNGMAVWI